LKRQGKKELNLLSKITDFFYTVECSNSICHLHLLMTFNQGTHCIQVLPTTYFPLDEIQKIIKQKIINSFVSVNENTKQKTYFVKENDIFIEGVYSSTVMDYMVKNILHHNNIEYIIFNYFHSIPLTENEKNIIVNHFYTSKFGLNLYGYSKVKIKQTKIIRRLNEIENLLQIFPSLKYLPQMEIDLDNEEHGTNYKSLIQKLIDDKSITENELKNELNDFEELMKTL
jgi:hypothetical protein